MQVIYCHQDHPVLRRSAQRKLDDGIGMAAALPAARSVGDAVIEPAALLHGQRAKRQIAVGADGIGDLLARRIIRDEGLLLGRLRGRFERRVGRRLRQRL